MYQNYNNFPYFALDEVIKDDKIDREKRLFELGFTVKYLYIHSHFLMQFDLSKSSPDKEKYLYIYH